MLRDFYHYLGIREYGPNKFIPIKCLSYNNFVLLAVYRKRQINLNETTKTFINEPHDGIVNIPGPDLRLACHIIYPSNDPNNRLATKRCERICSRALRVVTPRLPHYVIAQRSRACSIYAIAIE